MKPMIILPPEVMTPEDIQVLRDNGICVVVSKDPAKLKFLDPLPAQSSRSEMENASIKLSRQLLTGIGLNEAWWKNKKSDFAELYLDCLLQGTPLSAEGTREEQEQKIIDDARRTELYRIGQEEARAEVKARKEAKQKALEQSKEKGPK